MRTIHKAWLASSAAALSIAQAQLAHAQLDVDPPLPNVLLLVDTSGSMEYLTTPGADGKPQLPTCQAGEPLNRWASVVSALTGEIESFACKPVPRDNVFAAEYGPAGPPPYDFKYYLPFNRLTSNGCTPGPGTMPANWWEWPAGAINYHDISDVNKACTTPWLQKNNGVLDTYRDRIRFGLMTFDSFPNANTGINGNLPSMSSGYKGLWSYFADWSKGGGVPKQGNPANCAPTTIEVGARNQAAPPWEGRLIGFGPDDAPISEVHKINDHIQEAIVAMRPYGATPLAAMMDDAKAFLLDDTSMDPGTSPQKPFGPRDDAYYKSGCRQMYIIVLSDGEPNLDLRPECNQGNGQCPYPTPDDSASYLASLPGNEAIPTFVIGFSVEDKAALQTLGYASCSELSASDCVAPPSGLKACCELTKLAISGGTQHAYFPTSPADLKAVVSSILAGIASSSTARTVPIFSTATASAGAQGNALAASYRFVAQFKATSSGELWSGDLKRQRYVCTPQNGKLTPVPQEPDETLGDDFSSNVNSGDASNPRRFFTFVAPTDNNKIHSHQSIRPLLLSDDGLGLYGSGSMGALGPVETSTFASTIASGNSPLALSMDPANPPSACTSTLKANDTSSCVNTLMSWEASHAFGAIYHSTPAISEPPREGLRDESYITFAFQKAKRPTMLYTATTDGQLHAFKVVAGDPNDPLKVDTLANNELWSFFPPSVLPNLLGSYEQQTIVLDGTPVVADVVLERNLNKGAQWSTVLVAGGGAASSVYGFYYALDVSDPTSPKFLWQISTDTGDSPLFGAKTGTPAIATVALPDKNIGNNAVKEVAVAILPGGAGTEVQGACGRDNSTSLMKVGAYAPRTQVKCWDPGPARSLSIVRVDNGEVLMNFRGASSDGPSGLLSSKNQKVVPFSSPITGVPVAYPGRTGQLADRAYVGDADGNLWRIDLSSPDPANWDVSLAWDAYSNTTAGDDWQMSQPVETVPIVSTSPVGDVVLLFSTGDQRVFEPSASMHNRVWSLSEQWNPTAGKYEVSGNWYKDLLGGERVTGAMALFDSIAYFSTFSPAGTGAICSYGSSKVWGLDYLSASARFPDLSNPGSYKEFETADNTIIFGVAVTRTPSCSVSATSNDPYFGANTYLSDVTGGNYQLVWQKGPGQGVSNVQTDPYTGIQSINLPMPRQMTRIDAWAAVIE